MIPLSSLSFLSQLISISLFSKLSETHTHVHIHIYWGKNTVLSQQELQVVHESDNNIHTKSHNCGYRLVVLVLPLMRTRQTVSRPPASTPRQTSEKSCDTRRYDFVRGSQLWKVSLSLLRPEIFLRVFSHSTFLSARNPLPFFPSCLQRIAHFTLFLPTVVFPVYVSLLVTFQGIHLRRWYSPSGGRGRSVHRVFERGACCPASLNSFQNSWCLSWTESVVGSITQNHNKFVLTLSTCLSPGNDCKSGDTKFTQLCSMW